MHQGTHFCRGPLGGGPNFEGPYLQNLELGPVMGKSKSWFDLNHDSITGDDFIWVQNIRFGNMWFDWDLIAFYVIWFGYLNKSQLSVIWAKE